jgi:DNA polymerase III alpha subunit
MRQLRPILTPALPQVGMTDHGKLFGAAPFYNSAQAAGSHKSRTDNDRYNHLVLLCENP